MLFRFAALALVTLSLTAAAQDDAERAVSHYNLNKAKLAIDGYDPVAYFADGGSSPAKGKKDLTVEFEGALYRFANAANRVKFLEDPHRFEPYYGGWCAWAMAQGEKVEIDPESFLIERGRLLLFYKGFFNDTRKKWLKKDTVALGKTADAEWMRLSGEQFEVAHAVANELALGGTDPTTLEGGKAEAGSDKITTRYRGATYRFKSEANRLAFLRNPGRLAPAYGGFAADKLASGEFVPADAAHVLVHHGRVVLFSSAEGRDAWQESAETQKATDKAWIGHLKKLGEKK